MLEHRSFSSICTLVAGALAVAAPTWAHAPHRLTPGEPIFRPEVFFLGRTEGTGRLKILLGHHILVHVHGDGRIDRAGTLILDQDIEQAGKPVKHRRWEMKSRGGGTYVATLSDATGPVIGIVDGNTLRLSFRAKGGLRIRQSLVLSADGRTAANRLTIRKMGVVVATLHETIARSD